MNYFLTFEQTELFQRPLGLDVELLGVVDDENLRRMLKKKLLDLADEIVQVVIDFIFF